MYNITLKTVLRRVHSNKGFVYHSVGWDPAEPQALRVEVREREGSRGRCSGCGRKAPGYDRQPERRWSFVPLWAMAVFLVYAPRRVDCRRCGPTIEKVPWASGKHQNCDIFRLFLAKWARLLSWAEVAACFRDSWADVYSAVKWVVEFGIENRDLTGVSALGVDEIHVGKKDKFWSIRSTTTASVCFGSALTAPRPPSTTSLRFLARSSVPASASCAPTCGSPISTVPRAFCPTLSTSSSVSTSSKAQRGHRSDPP